MSDPLRFTRDAVDADGAPIELTAEISKYPVPTDLREFVARLNATPEFSAHFTASVGFHYHPDGSHDPQANLIIMAKDATAGDVRIEGIPANETETRSGADPTPSEPIGGFSSAEILGFVDVTIEAGIDMVPPPSGGGGGGGGRGFGNADERPREPAPVTPPGDPIPRPRPSGADDAIRRIDRAIEIVSRGRIDIGVMHNRFEHTIRNLGVSTENLSLAESRIRDADIAREVSELRKRQITISASMEMLTRAQAIPQTVLKLVQ